MAATLDRYYRGDMGEAYIPRTGDVEVECYNYRTGEVSAIVSREFLCRIILYVIDTIKLRSVIILCNQTHGDRSKVTFFPSFKTVHPRKVLFQRPIASRVRRVLSFTGTVG